MSSSSNAKEEEDVKATTTTSSSSSSSSSNNVPAGSTKGAVSRLMSDYKEMQLSAPAGISAAPVNESNLFVWNASIIGPDDSPWEGGIYALRLQFPETYPSKPPRVRFLCEMFHPNVYSDGSLCLDIIQDNWSMIYTVSSILTSIQSLLTDPNPNSPANPEAARMYTENVKEYRKRVRKIAQRSIES